VSLPIIQINIYAIKPAVDAIVEKIRATSYDRVLLSADPASDLFVDGVT
jgi:hypothetical protein